jgi:hypothetical protein
MALDELLKRGYVETVMEFGFALGGVRTKTGESQARKGFTFKGLREDHITRRLPSMIFQPTRAPSFI